MIDLSKHNRTQDFVNEINLEKINEAYSFLAIWWIDSIFHSILIRSLSDGNMHYLMTIMCYTLPLQSADFSSTREILVEENSWPTLALSFLVH